MAVSDIQYLTELIEEQSFVLMDLQKQIAFLTNILLNEEDNEDEELDD
jgi:hypothetical protein